jgi:hypothetical protein
MNLSRYKLRESLGDLVQEYIKHKNLPANQRKVKTQNVSNILQNRIREAINSSVVKSVSPPVRVYNEEFNRRVQELINKAVSAAEAKSGIQGEKKMFVYNKSVNMPKFFSDIRRRLSAIKRPAMFRMSTDLTAAATQAAATQVAANKAAANKAARIKAAVKRIIGSPNYTGALRKLEESNNRNLYNNIKAAVNRHRDEVRNVNIKIANINRKLAGMTGNNALSPVAKRNLRIEKARLLRLRNTKR